MKKTLVWLCFSLPVLVQAQPVLLPQAEVHDSLLPKLSIGHHLTTLSPNASSDLGTQLAGKSPLVLNQSGPNLLASQYLRGVYTDAIQVYWNGMPVNAPTLGLSDVNVFNPTTIEQIAILPGGSGAELGSGSFGGSVFLNNVLSTKPRRLQELSVGVGSFGRTTFNSTTQLGTGKQGYRLSTFYDGATNDYPYDNPFGDRVNRINSAYNRYGVQGSARIQAGNALIESHLLLQDLFRELPVSSAAVNPGDPPIAWQADQMFRWQNTVQFNGWRIEQGFAVEKQRYNNRKALIDDANNFSQSSTEVRKSIFKNEHLQWSAGGYANLYQANGDNVNKGQTEYGVRTEFIHHPSKKWLYKVSLSADFVDRVYLKQLDSLATNPIPVLPSFALQYVVNKHLLLRGNVAEVFNNPTLNERYWPGGGVQNIQPEHGYSSEVGADYFLDNAKWSMATHITAYYLKLYNRVRWISAGGGLFRPENISESYSSGVELAQDWTYTEVNWKASLSFNVNYTRAIVLHDAQLGAEAEGKQLVNIPLLSGGTQLNVAFSRVSVYLSGLYNSGAYTTSDNDLFFKLDPFVVLNTGIAYAQKIKRFALVPSLHVLNFTNVSYQTQWYQPMPGISFNFNIKLTYQL
jgi:outer membrane receptor protein involved in Fe transport